MSRPSIFEVEDLSAGELSWISQAESLIARGVAVLEVDRLGYVDVNAAIVQVTRMQHQLATARAHLARRAADMGAWRHSGSPSAAAWLAGKTGSSVGNAIGELAAGEAMAAQPTLDAAARAGELSSEQMKEIAPAVTANPGAAPELIGAAKKESLPKLRDRCRKRRAEGESRSQAKEREERIRRNRRIRGFTDHDGASCLDVRGPAEDVAAIRAAFEPFARAAFDRARADGRRESSEAYAFDGLVAWARSAMQADATPAAANDSGTSTKTRRARKSTTPGTTVNYVVPAEAVLAGGKECDKTIEILGVGPCSLEALRKVLPDSAINVVITKGVDIANITSLARHPTGTMLTALWIRSGGRCEVPQCTRRVDIWDHTMEWAKTHRTRLDELAGICGFHDHQRTHCGGQLDRIDGGWVWTPPTPEALAADAVRKTKRARKAAKQRR